jgi:hypothetical protein
VISAVSFGALAIGQPVEDAAKKSTLQPAQGPVPYPPPPQGYPQPPPQTYPAPAMPGPQR